MTRYFVPLVKIFIFSFFFSDFMSFHPLVDIGMGFTSSKALRSLSENAGPTSAPTLHKSLKTFPRFTLNPLFEISFEDIFGGG